MTLKRYKASFDSFVKFYRPLRLEDSGSLADRVDLSMVHYLEVLWQEGEGKTVAEYCYASTLHFAPILKGKIPCALRLLNGWRRLELPARAAPLSLDMLLCLCAVFLLWGFLDESLCLLIGFDLFLRTGELTNLRRNSFTVSDTEDSAVITLDDTKTVKKKIAACESLVIRDPFVLKAVRLLLRDDRQLLSGDRVMRLSPAQFNRVFVAAIKFLKWNDLGVKPYSVRRGGATLHFRTHGNMASTILRGRWQSSRTARIYIEDGMATLAQLQLSMEQLNDVRSLRSHFISQICSGFARLGCVNESA